MSRCFSTTVLLDVPGEIDYVPVSVDFTVQDGEVEILKAVDANGTGYELDDTQYDASELLTLAQSQSEEDRADSIRSRFED